MKTRFSLLLLITIFVSTSVAAQTTIKTYENKQFNFSFKYHAKFALRDQMARPGTATMTGYSAAQAAVSQDLPTSKGALGDWAGNIGQSAASTAVGSIIANQMIKGAMKGIKITSLTLVKKGRPDAQIMLNVMEGMAGSPAETPPSAKQSSQGGGSGESNCKVLEDKKVQWGPKKPKMTLMRCKQGDDTWQYTGTVMMKVKSATYILMASMTSEIEDISDYNKTLGETFAMVLESTKIK